MIKTHWTSYRDGITKATVYTLLAHKETWSPATHIDGHGIQVYGERKETSRGSGRKVMHYTPVIRFGPYGENAYEGDETRDLESAKQWAINKSVKLGMLKVAANV